MRYGWPAYCAIGVMMLIIAVGQIVACPYSCDLSVAVEDEGTEGTEFQIDAAPELDIDIAMTEVPVEEMIVDAPVSVPDAEPTDKGIVAFGSEIASDSPEEQPRAPVEGADDDMYRGVDPKGQKTATPDDRGRGQFPPAPRGHDQRGHFDAPVTDANLGMPREEPGMDNLPDPTTVKPSEKPSDTIAPRGPDFTVDPKFEKEVIDPMQDEGRFEEITKTKRYTLSFAVVTYLNQLSQDLNTCYYPDGSKYEDSEQQDDIAETEYAVMEDSEEDDQETVYIIAAEPFIPPCDLPVPVIKVGPGIIQA